MKKKMSALLCLVMVGSMSLPVFGFTIHPVDMSKVDVYIGDEKVYDGQTGTVLVEPNEIEQEKKIAEEIEAKTYNLPNGLKSFKDVHSSFWAYDAIMSMTEKGLFAGITKPIDGIGTFNPNGVMTRVQFITVITRALFANSLANMTTEGPWYTPNWNIAVETGILKEEDLGGFENLNQPINREEMSYVMANVLKYKEETVEKLVDKSAIADYNTIGSYYTDSVLTCYSKGIIAGVDMKGSFAPKMTVSRAQGATLIYRLLNPEVRVSVDLDNASN